MKYPITISALLTAFLFLMKPVMASDSLTVSSRSLPGAFPLVENGKTASIYTDLTDAKVVEIAARAFSKDVDMVTGAGSSLVHNVSTDNTPVVLAGTIGQSAWLDELIGKKMITVSELKGKWERFKIQIVTASGGKKILVVAGSDRRGTAYGLFHLSRLMGVSPFIWWADVLPEKKPQLFISGKYVSTEPSVQYRGIFLNDEDWGLQPWAAQKMDTDIKDIGPKTYAKIFELLLRLKANYIWPAMHPSTKAFYYYKENPKVADDYAIVVGSSHAEPMLRNNVFEWNIGFQEEYGKQHGEWRYDTNKDEIFRYWNDRAKQARNYESVFTMGMRGVHDSGMPGPKDPDEKVKLLETIISDQRGMLESNFGKSAATVPQIFVPYKEVLSLYRRGMKLPEDITIIWPDDNHGYIRQLPDAAERKRNGGHGVYYHLSYWGSPADYLWLSSISPSLIGYEMKKAYDYQARKLWVFNVGDIKPAELEMTFALDMAWDILTYHPADPSHYLRQWAIENFGKENAESIIRIKQLYYRLAAGGKPEHLNLLSFTSKEIFQRLDSCQELESRVENVSTIDKRLNDAWFQLIKYPALGAVWMNRKILYQQLATLQKNNGDTKLAAESLKLADQAYQLISELTLRYNRFIASGKWNGIMSWHPRDQKVFDKPPVFDSLKTGANENRKLKNEMEGQRVEIITAEQLNRGENLSGLMLLPGLGVSGAGLTPSANSTSSQITIKRKWNAGVYKIVMKCLPLYSMEGNRELNYRISVNGKDPQTVNVHAEADSPAWKENVIRGYSVGESVHKVLQDGIITIGLDLLDKHIVVSQIEIYKID